MAKKNLFKKKLSGRILVLFGVVAWLLSKLIPSEIPFIVFSATLEVVGIISIIAGLIQITSGLFKKKKESIEKGKKPTKRLKSIGLIYRFLLFICVFLTTYFASSLKVAILFTLMVYLVYKKEQIDEKRFKKIELNITDIATHIYSIERALNKKQKEKIDWTVDFMKKAKKEKPWLF